MSHTPQKLATEILNNSDMQGYYGLESVSSRIVLTKMFELFEADDIQIEVSKAPIFLREFGGVEVPVLMKSKIIPIDDAPYEKLADLLALGGSGSILRIFEDGATRAFRKIKSSAGSSKAIFFPYQISTHKRLNEATLERIYEFWFRFALVDAVTGKELS